MASRSPFLLPYQRTLVSEVHDPKTSDLVVIGRGLGLQKIVCTLLQIYDGPQNLVLLINASGEEEKSIGSQLGTMGVRNPGLRIVDYEMSKKDRQLLYKKGGLISVTSRILVVDLLLKDIPVELITGMVILHAEKVTPTSLECFVVRLFRKENKDGFVKAFSDQPEQFTQGMFPLKSVITELQLKRTHIYPRFHEEVQTSLGRRKADVVELYVPMTPKMQDIHQGIVHCISATLNELKKSNSTLDLDDLTVENAYFASFDSIVRRQLDSVWHKIGPKTKQLVNDLGTLRRLLNYLLALDPITFHSYLESIVASNSSTSLHPLARQEKSDWLFTEAAHIIITTAKARCYAMTPKQSATADNVDDDWAILDEVQGATGATQDGGPRWLPWMPGEMQPVLEEPGKWSVLAEVLLEIEHEMISRPSRLMEPGTNTVLVMVNDHRTATLIQEFLASMHQNPDSPGRPVLERRLRSYLWWKSMLSKSDERPSGNGNPTVPANRSNQDDGISEALRRKDHQRAAAKQARRRVRGGGDVRVVNERDRKKELERSGLMPNEADLEIEAELIADFLATQATMIDEGQVDSGLYMRAGEADQEINRPVSSLEVEELQEGGLGAGFDDDYGLLTPEQIVAVRVYGDDGDDGILQEMRPRYIIVYDPNQDFIRRIEVYRSSNPGLAVRVYFMAYHLTSEEHKYLAGQRREKDAFERLIKERGSMLLTIGEPVTSSYSEKVTALSTRIGGVRGATVDEAEPPRVIVDMREFRSSLPNLLDKARLQVVPATLTVGDYILTPDMCVERKSVPDLIQSFNSGRLYTQCELMSAHYNYPILLIEFEESRSFSLQTLAETKSGAKKKQAEKGKDAGPKPSNANDSLIQSKLVLLTLSFPRLRVIWSSSPHASVDIIRELKTNFPEPDVIKAISMGTDEDGGGAQLEDVNTLSEDLLRALPGIGTKNLRYVMNRVGSVAALCEMSLEELEDLLGVEPGKKCHEFVHKGLKQHPLGGLLPQTR
ncbi:hypothetical protein M407DRAFT_217107 [Tulasnella calospora MUT 4182]|uniref:ERCC4 domain-containing protein n=1 Tax=Tulasnella calospora MUT 4182 TaxID=1051891 RepID=A0A0C3MDP0_9AGAM|nr:hypothetical protein M407DRAFT_217107 [Tulasnella calospora MUT 4182]